MTLTLLFIVFLLVILCKLEGKEVGNLTFRQHIYTVWIVRKTIGVVAKEMISQPDTPHLYYKLLLSNIRDSNGLENEDY